MAAAVTKACVDSALQLGLPEARIPLAEAVILLATSPKSNSAEAAIDAALEDGQGALELFNQFKYAVEKINQGDPADVITYIFEVNLLRYFGVGPEWRGCLVCGETQGAFDYSPKYHGILCQNHFHLDEHRYHASPRSIQLLRLFSVTKIEKLGKINIEADTKREIRRVLDKIYEENVGIHLKSKKFLDDMEKWLPED